MHHRHYHSPIARGLWSFVLVASVLIVGTVGLHHLEGLSYLDAFYVVSMIATAQGPATVPVTPGGKLFTALLAFVSVGAVIVSVGFLFGPFFGKLWRVGVEKVEEELRHLARRNDT